MNGSKTRTTEESEIRALVDDWADGIRTKTVEKCLSHYAPDILLFDLAPPLRYNGADAVRKSWQAWFPTFEGSIGYEIRDLQITASGNVAFSQSLNRIRGKRTSGEETDVWIRATVGFRKIDGKWLITHEHVSVPFYMDGSYKAAIDLRP